MSLLSEVFSYEAFVHAVAGTVGGATAMTVFYPLDVIRTHMQVTLHKESSVHATMELVKKEGIEALYRGLSATLISLGCSNFVYFYANNLFKVLLRKFTGKEVTVLQNLFVASLAGVINVFLTCPLWVANTRLKLQKRKTDSEKFKGTFDAIKKIAEKEGVLALWNGTSASLLLVSNPTIHFVVYDKVKSLLLARVLEKGLKHLSSFEIFLNGAIAKASATVLTYPIQMAQTRLRSAATLKEGEKESIHKYRNTTDVLLKVFRTDGILGWFAGLNAKLLQTVLTAAFQFLCYEHIKALIFRFLAKQKK